MKSLVFSLLLCLPIHADGWNPAPVPVIHSHNDYLQDKPLSGALAAGAGSIEVDVFLTDGELLVAHMPWELLKRRTLERLYVQPLRDHVKKTGEVPELQLLVDVKSKDADAAVTALEKVFGKHPEIFSNDGVRVVISGNRPARKDFGKYADFIWFDGRGPAEAAGPGGERVAIVSQSLSKFTRWRGKGEIDEKERKAIVDFVAKCHKRDRPVRFWNSGDNLAMYEFICSVGADFINTDKPDAVRAFLMQRAGAEPAGAAEDE